MSQGTIMKNLNTSKPEQQKGSVLILSLMILVVLTMIGVSSMSSSSLQEKMTGNFRDREVAFHVAERTLALAEEYLEANINTANLPNTGGLYTRDNGPTHATVTTGTWWTGSNSQVLSTTIDETRTQPRFTIEYHGEVGNSEGTSINLGGYGSSTGGGTVSNFKVTAYANGLSNNTQVILQSNYNKRL